MVKLANEPKLNWKYDLRFYISMKYFRKMFCKILVIIWYHLIDLLIRHKQYNVRYEREGLWNIANKAHK